MIKIMEGVQAHTLGLYVRTIFLNVDPIKYVPSCDAVKWSLESGSISARYHCDGFEFEVQCVTLGSKIITYARRVSQTASSDDSRYKLAVS